MKKSNGQIWIDKKPPYNLMYRAGLTNETATDRVIQAVSKYKASKAEGSSLQVGNLISLNSKGGAQASVFPDDLNNVIGVATGIEEEAGNYWISTATTGEVYILKSLIKENQDPGNLESLNKRILYWNVVDESAPYTLMTPSEDKSISYLNLPVIGYITSFYGYEGNGEYVTVQLNMGPFDSVLEFYCERKISDEKGNILSSIEITHNLTKLGDGKVRLSVYDLLGNFIPVDQSDAQGKTKIEVNKSLNKDMSLFISGEVFY